MKIDDKGRFVRQSLEERFWPKVSKDGPVVDHIPNIGRCWAWTGARNFFGYGVIHRDDDRGVERAHRVSWAIHFGKIDRATLVLHRCDNPSCVNPSHLFLGTHADNVADKVSKNRQNKGETDGMAKLTADQIAEIFRLNAEGASRREIGARFGVERHHVGRILMGRRWAHVTFPKVSKASTKLDAEKVLQIRALYKAGLSQQKIAVRFSCNQTLVSAILRGKVWKHVA